MRILKGKIKLEMIFIAIILIVITIILFNGKIAGIADNGDFNRVLRPTHMWYEQDKTYDDLYFKYVNHKYDILNPLPTIDNNYLNTHVLTVLLAKTINVIVYSSDKFDIRFLSFIYIVLLLLGMFILMKNLKTKNVWINIIIFTLLTLIIADSSNILYFNSLYAEPNAYVFFILSLSFLSSILKKKEPKLLDGILFFISTTLFLGSKIQYAPLAILFLPLFLYLFKFYNTKRSRIILTICFTLMIGINSILFFIQPKYLNEVTTYNSVFSGILKNEETAGDFLHDLGLDQKYKALAGTNGFQSDYPIDINSEEFRRDFYDKIGKKDIVLFYLRHPDLLMTRMFSTGEVTFINKPEHLGNRTKSFSQDAVAVEFFSGYYAFKKIMIPKRFVFVLTFFFLYLFVATYKYLKNSKIQNRIACLYIATLIIFCGIQYVLPTIGDGGLDTAKQLYMFNVVFDFLVFIIMYRVILSWGTFKNK
ncbi:hypothetical protein SAMN04488689_11124 [Paenibacillus sp. cl6col]|uniref:Transmembrane protein n=1 Tax=Paenibacillus alvei TaxID=44250 RepID=A0ABT4E4C1_PAEAL|nr:MULTISPECIES: hypothetical protein [Paenibacillus]MCY9528599.1 hypothetical protein [Paenibacillus alvei]SDG22158.1 hypothetical protein SAMN04488689_11124 [Paenibacillus sp. cl6col]